MTAECMMCSTERGDDELLLCDGCDRGCHMSCLDPPLKEIPEEDWFCTFWVFSPNGSPTCGPTLPYSS